MKTFAATGVPTGTFFQASNPGWGLCISSAQNGQHVAIGLFFTDADGKPNWLFGSGPADSGVFELNATKCDAFPAGNPTTQFKGWLRVWPNAERNGMRIAWEQYAGIDVSPPPPPQILEADLIAL